MKINPYEVKEARPDAPPKTFSWFAIFKADVVYFLALMVCTFCHILASPYNGFTEATLANLLINGSLVAIPWMSGAIYLSTMVQRSWILHGIIYSLLTGMLVLSGVATNGKSMVQNLITIATWQAGSTAVALVTMAITKQFLKTKRIRNLS